MNSHRTWWLKPKVSDFEITITVESLVTHISRNANKYWFPTSVQPKVHSFKYIMSDREGLAGGGSSDEDLSLPKATVSKMIAGMRFPPCLRIFASHFFYRTST